MKDDIAYVRHIRECIRRIEGNVAEGRERFIESHVLQDAVLILQRHLDFIYFRNVIV